MQIVSNHSKSKPFLCEPKVDRNQGKLGYVVGSEVPNQNSKFSQLLSSTTI